SPRRCVRAARGVRARTILASPLCLSSLGLEGALGNGTWRRPSPSSRGQGLRGGRATRQTLSSPAPRLPVPLLNAPLGAPGLLPARTHQKPRWSGALPPSSVGSAGSPIQRWLPAYGPSASLPGAELKTNRILSRLCLRPLQWLLVALGCCLNNLVWYGYVTNSKVKFVMVVDSSNTALRDNEIRSMFRKLHNSYTDVMCNPFYNPGDRIQSRAFDNMVTSMMIQVC
uniref:Trafficking protein particle complex subunit 2L n=1 Tax=Macaca mulatta TaxID=9544 RepID=A0A5F8A4X4_MACMU